MILFAIFCITLMTAIGTSAIPPALPVVAAQFGVSPDAAGLVMAVFTLPGIFLTPLLGVLADRIGKRAIVLPSLLVFAVGGAMAPLASSFSMLLVIRTIQGIGAASLGALNVALISDFFSGERRTAVMGFNNSVLSIGTALFPIVGGALAKQSYVYPFALPLLALPVMLVVFFVIKDNTSGVVLRFSDYTSALKREVADANVLRLFVMSIATFALLFGPFLTYLPFLSQQLLGCTPQEAAVKAGIQISAMSVSTAITAYFLGTISRKIPQAVLLLISLGLYASALALYPWMPQYGLLFVPSVLFGVAQAFNQPNVQALLAAIVGTEQRAAMLSFNRTLSLIGQTLGPVVFALPFRSGGIIAVFVSGVVVALVLAIFMKRFTVSAEASA